MNLCPACKQPLGKKKHVNGKTSYLRKECLTSDCVVIEVRFFHEPDKRRGFGYSSSKVIYDTSSWIEPLKG